MTAAAQPIRICLIGAGRAGRVHANSHGAAHRRGASSRPSSTSVAETRDKRSRRLRHRHELSPTSSDALDWGQFDAVVITTPTFTHRDFAVAAASAGKHVFVEKPMALTLAECDAMIAAAEKSGVALQIGFMRRFDPDFSAAYERIRGRRDRPADDRSSR